MNKRDGEHHVRVTLEQPNEISSLADIRQPECDPIHDGVTQIRKGQHMAIETTNGVYQLLDSLPC